MPENRLRERLRKQETNYGLWVTLESPAVTEIAVTLGLDWVCIDMEHGHLGFREVMEHVRVVRGSATTALVRVPEIGQSSIKRALDIGAHGVLLPLVRGREDVDRGMSFARYPPRGVRGVSGERAVQWGLGLREYVASADEETLVIPIIETREAAEEIDAILDVPGLEAIFFGPADLSASHGHLGDWEGPGMAALILEIRGKAAAKGIGAGVMSRSIEDSVRRRDQGFGMVGLGSDAGLLIRALTEALERVRGPVAPQLWF
jgi:2-keto-3-deoxy-L-rhamnonate aldolase RhmA